MLTSSYNFQIIMFTVICKPQTLAGMA